MNFSPLFILIIFILKSVAFDLIIKHQRNSTQIINSKLHKTLQTKENLINCNPILIFGETKYFNEVTQKNEIDTYAMVKIENTDIKVQTNETGKFSLLYLPKRNKEKIRLVFSALGFTQKKITIKVSCTKNNNMGIIFLKQANSFKCQ